MQISPRLSAQPKLVVSSFSSPVVRHCFISFLWARRTLRSVSWVLDLIRNQKSLARPNPLLLEEAEATLAINSIRTVLHYLDKKIG